MYIAGKYQVWGERWEQGVYLLKVKKQNILILPNTHNSTCYIAVYLYYILNIYLFLYIDYIEYIFIYTI